MEKDLGRLLRAACRSAAWDAVRPRVSQRAAEEEELGVLVRPGDSARESESTRSIRDKFIPCLKCIIILNLQRSYTLYTAL